MSADIETIYHIRPIADADGKDGRRQRLAGRLRDNLRKRKEQQRAREDRERGQSPEPTSDHDATPIDAGDPHQLDIEA